MNNCSFLGRLTKNPEMTMTNSNMAITKFTMAVDKKNAKKLKEEGKPNCDFLNFVAFGKSGEVIANFVEKGQKLVVVCSVSTNTVEKEHGKVVYTNFVVEQFDFVDYKAKDTQSKPSGNFVAFDQEDFSDFKQMDDDQEPIPF